MKNNIITADVHLSIEFLQRYQESALLALKEMGLLSETQLQLCMQEILNSPHGSSL